MPALTIKNIPDKLYHTLKYSAEIHRRSINSEVITYLENALYPRKVSAIERLNRVEALRADIQSDAVTVDDIEDAINSGRP